MKSFIDDFAGAIHDILYYLSFNCWTTHCWCTSLFVNDFIWIDF